MADSPRQLDIVQQWFQAVITHPGGVADGAESEAAQKLIHLNRSELEKVIRRSRNLTAEERIHIYANAYYARLMECLRESFPVLTRTLGEDVFNDFAFEYLRRFGPSSYTLNRLGDHFAEFLELTRPDREEGISPSPGTSGEGRGEGPVSNAQDPHPALSLSTRRGCSTSEPPPNWPDFLIDLARLEWTIEQVFDGPGVEKEKLLSNSDLQSIPPGDWSRVRLIPVICLKLMQFKYPVNAYYTAVRQAKDGQTIDPPEPGEQFLALNRREYVVRRIELTRPQYLLLDAISNGHSIAEAIQSVNSFFELPDEQLGLLLRQWFEEWARAGFFRAIELKRA